jgi:hypothetical protein
MSEFRNATFDDIAVGRSESTTRQMSVIDVEALALAAGEVDPFHLEGGITR